MKRTFQIIGLLLAMGAAAFTGCRFIDEDLSGCGAPLTVDYQLRLVTNMRMELETVLSLNADLELSTALETYLEGVFTDYARDVDLSFYDTQGDMPILEHMSETMDATQSSYTLYIPVRNYMHTCVANIAQASQVSLEGKDFCRTGRLVQHAVDGVADPHESGLFTARKRMDILAGVDQSFDVHLFMANAATGLVLDKDPDANYKDIRVEVTGFADGFNIADSTYTYAAASLSEGKDIRFRTHPVQVENSDEVCYTSVHFPSRDLPDSKSVIETEEPFIAGEADEALWEWIVYVVLEDDTITRTTLSIRTPLRAGQFKIVRAMVYEGGTVSTSNPLVGVSVTLDWQPGSDHQVEF